MYVWYVLKNFVKWLRYKIFLFNSVFSTQFIPAPTIFALTENAYAFSSVSLNYSQ